MKRKYELRGDRSVLVQMFAAGILALLVDLLWPKRYAIPFPWEEPVFDAVLWCSPFLVVSKPLWTQLRFWVALAVGIATQVWAEKSVVLAGAPHIFRASTVTPRHLNYETAVAFLVLGVAAWGLTYLLLSWVRRNWMMKTPETEDS